MVDSRDHDHHLDATAVAGCGLRPEPVAATTVVVGAPTVDRRDDHSRPAAPELAPAAVRGRDRHQDDHPVVQGLDYHPKVARAGSHCGRPAGHGYPMEAHHCPPADRGSNWVAVGLAHHWVVDYHDPADLGCHLGDPGDDRCHPRVDPDAIPADPAPDFLQAADLGANPGFRLAVFPEADRCLDVEVRTESALEAPLAAARCRSAAEALHPSEPEER